MTAIPEPTASYLVGYFLAGRATPWPHRQCVYHVHDGSRSIYVGKSNNPQYRLKMHMLRNTSLGAELRNVPGAMEWHLHLYTPAACLPVVEAVLEPVTVKTFRKNLAPARWDYSVDDAEDAMIRALRPLLNKMGAWQKPYDPASAQDEPVVLVGRAPGGRRKK